MDSSDEYDYGEKISDDNEEMLNKSSNSSSEENDSQNRNLPQKNQSQEDDKDLEEFLKRIPIVDANTPVEIDPIVEPEVIKKKEKIEDMWVDKYKPKTIDDIIGNEDIIKDVIEWLAKFRKHDPDIKRAIILAGSPGVGKTTCARIISEHCGFVAHEFNASDQRSKKSLQQTMFQLAKSTDVLEFFKAGRQADRKPKKHVIIMEEIDGMTHGDYGGIAELASVLNIKACNKREDKWWSPIICTTNLDNIGKIKKLMRHCHVFTFESPDKANLQTLFNKVMMNENLVISQKSQDFIIEHSQQDYRRLLFLLQIICLPKIHIVQSQRSSQSPSSPPPPPPPLTNLFDSPSTPSTPITIDDEYVEEMVDSFEKKHNNYGIDGVMEELTSFLKPPYERMNLDRIISLAEMEYYLVPASFHENFLNWFPKKRKKRKNIEQKNDKSPLDLIDIDQIEENKNDIHQTYQISEIQRPKQIDYSKINPKNIKFVIQDDNEQKEQNINNYNNYSMLQCMCDVIEDISFKDFLFPLSNAASYDSFIQENVSLFSVAMPLSHMEKYFKQSNTSCNTLKLAHPKQFTNAVSYASQLKVFRELKNLLPHIDSFSSDGRDILLYYKNRMLSYIVNEQYNDLVELLYNLELLPEQIPILLRVREANEDNKLTKKCWTLKIQKIVIKLFDAYNEKQYKLFNLQPIDIRQDSRRIIEMNN